ncbi:hypothetical protein PHYSODRAFT_286251 [Phytophthora sojae]|uniref:RxLR effector protein n=2 Tax=Phytophthora sojae TaxID=67593 RepID=G4ZP73_PHYSP|nr:hypothetical protein PHYSODRAFT_286251 [Phytophthora sojae]AEK80729.1 Avh139 [Phytophthora sojae]AEK80730.1 Avh139 [Phytophthora sojae]EGZ15113.1 hypothetical protein PHYSODRAFT_286251 [Phytophthora sojae]|eukprot:XP_009528862.1 hypothetical protein PHYSODRAFT_286251 [Phytophthora sojae]
MRVHYIALLVAAPLARTDAASAATESKMATPDFRAAGRSIATDQRPQRLLRSHKTIEKADDEKEERVFSIKFLDDFLENNQLKGWLKDSVSARDAIKLTKLDDAGANLFTSTQWKTFSTYVTMADKSNADQEMATALMGHYGPDKLVDKLAAAAKVPETKEIATKLDDGLIKFWKGLDTEPNNLFTILKLENKADDLFDSPAIDTWVKYLKVYNEKHPNKPVSMTEVVGSHYGGEKEFLTMLAKADDANSAGAKKLQNEVIKSWMDDPSHPMNIFTKKLGLDKAGDKVFSDPLLVTYVQYMKAFNKEYPHTETTLIQALSKSYGEKLPTMLEAAKKVPSTEKLATNLQAAQFKQWIAEGKTPDAVFKKVLKLESTSSPDADIWRAYYKAYDAEHPGKLFSFNP